MKPLWLLPLSCLCWPAGSLAVPKMQPAPTAGKPPARIAPKPASRNSSAAYQEATRLYQAGKYAEAAKLLRDDGGGDGSELAQSSLHIFRRVLPQIIKLLRRTAERLRQIGNVVRPAVCQQ
mgnify:CR=1 FL=1